jgi:predicted DNA-binding transcriptional regulator AlpA
MKRNRKEQQFLEQLQTIPNISLACEKVGLSRNTIYRWCKEDPSFKDRLDEAIETGTESVNDLAESKLISQINASNMQAIRYWLDNNKKTYTRPRPKDFWERHVDDHSNCITQFIIETTDKIAPPYPEDLISSSE